MLVSPLTGRSRDALERLRADFAEHGPVWRLAGSRTLWVADPQVARAILANRDGQFMETSDFFMTKHGVFGPRRSQLDIGRAARRLLRQELQARRATLPSLVATRLAGRSEWPDAANLLVYEHLRPVLLAPDSPADLVRLVERIIYRAVLAGARERYSLLSRYRFRREVMACLARHIRYRSARRDETPRDLLDIVAAHAENVGPTRLSELAEVYLSLLFATVSSMGFAVAWPIYLLGTHPEADGCPTEWIVRESMRLWPVAWLFGRRPAKELDIAGHRIGPRDSVNVCSYLAHRHPAHWPDPDEFQPQRWATASADAITLTFGHGQHSCTGSQQAISLVEDLVEVIRQQWTLSVTPSGLPQKLRPALAPPPFQLLLTRPSALSTVVQPQQCPIGSN